MERIFEHQVTPESKERMSFEERYEGFCVDLIKVGILRNYKRLTHNPPWVPGETSQQRQFEKIPF